jgi:hypothetical protein
MAPSGKLIKRLGFKAIELTAGIAVWLAIVCFEPPATRLSAAIFAAVVGLVLAVHLDGLLLRDEVQDIRTSQGWLAKLAESPHLIDREFLKLILKYPGGKISGSQIMEAWHDLCWIFEKCYEATNYIKPNEIYTEAWARPALAIQIAKALSPRDLQIRKVFLIDDGAELEPVRDLLNTQVDAGIFIKHSKYAKIAASPLLKGPFRGTEVN